MEKFFRFLYRYNELLIWSAALVFLYYIHPNGEEHFSFCLFKLAGFDHCPGCGIGRSIHEAMHFNFAGSWNYHWFGIPALMIIIVRVFKLFKNTLYGPNAAKPAYEHA